MTKPMIRPGLNFVVVRPIGRPGDSAAAGMVAAEFVDEHLLSSCIGIVEQVCSRTYYGGYDILKMGRNPTGKDMLVGQDINMRSLYFDVDVEVKPGDIVVYRYLPNIDPDAKVGDVILMRYDELVARVDWKAVTNNELGLDEAKIERLYPLNGGVLLEMRNEQLFGGGMAGPVKRELAWGTVVAQGMPVRSYLLWPQMGGDFDLDLTGKRVGFRAAAAVRIEHDAYRLLGGGEYPLYQIHRCFINCYLDG